MGVMTTSPFVKTFFNKLKQELFAEQNIYNDKTQT